MKSYSTILFDLDGTLSDSSQGIINSSIYALEKYDVNDYDMPLLRKFLGPPLHESFEKFMGFDKEKSLQAVKLYREYFSSKGLFENEIYGGVSDLLQNLKENGKALIVATSKPQLFTDRIMEHFNLAKYFDFIAGSNMDTTRSKKAEVIEYALSECNIKDKSKVVMIGDRAEDVIGAQTVGVNSIGVEYGYGTFDELKKMPAQHILLKRLTS
ncbi:MAG: HAD-IA family hydrolase [Anaerotruncus sp.]|nr:MAG: HAD-IA family hydrolase [Anaerotruncus sp.]